MKSPFQFSLTEMGSMGHFIAGQITKSNLMTMGSLHSWPSVLGCLGFLLEAAKVWNIQLLILDFKKDLQKCLRNIKKSVTFVL